MAKTFTWRGAAWATLDQGAYGALNILPTLWIANRLEPDAYGAFALTMTVVFLEVGIHSALFVEPMLVLSPEHFSKDSRYVPALVRLHAWFCAAAAALLAVVAFGVSLVSRDFGIALAASGVIGVTSMSVALVRRLAHVTDPRLGIVATLLYGAGLALGLCTLEWILGWSLWKALLVMAVPGVALAPILLRLARRPGSAEAAMAPDALVSLHWRGGKWVLLLSPFRWAVDNLPLILTGTLLGLSQAAALRAAANLVTPVIQIIGSLRLSAMPGFVSAIADQRSRAFARTQVGVITTVSAVNFGLLLLLGRPFMHFVYGGRYDAAAALLPTFGLLPCVLGAALTVGSMLRASQAFRQPFVAFVIAAVLEVAFVVAGIMTLGAQGAALGMVAGYVVLLLAKLYFAVPYFRAADRPAETSS